LPWDSARRRLLRDRDGVYGAKFREAATWHGTQEVLTALQSPWQNAYVERLIVSIRRGCQDPVFISNHAGVHRALKSYFKYCERTCMHLSLEKDAPIPRSVQPPEFGKVVEPPQLGGLHHRYERRAG
jgi:hypothetical protein